MPTDPTIPKPIFDQRVEAPQERTFMEVSQCMGCGGPMKPIIDKQTNQLWCVRMSVVRQGESQAIVIGGGPNMLLSMRTCAGCGRTELYNLTTLKLDPANPAFDPQRFQSG